jgi:hypothetical protein
MEGAMPVLDATALETDREGLALLKAVLGTGEDRPGRRRPRPEPGSLVPRRSRPRLAAAKAPKRCEGPAEPALCE